jgi:hypothetical protein
MTALWCGARKRISRQSGGASIRRGLTLSSSSFIPAVRFLSLACSKAIAFPAPAVGLRVLAAISQESPCRVHDDSPLTPTKIPCVLGRRRRGGWHRVPPGANGGSTFSRTRCTSSTAPAAKASLYTTTITSGRYHGPDWRFGRQPARQ